METISHTMELFGAFLTGVVGPVAYFLVNRYFQKHKESKRDKIKENINITSIITDELEQMRTEFDSDRVWISQFHNGGNFYPTGKSIQKFSIFYEVSKAGISTVSHTFNNIPCSLYNKAFQKMMMGDGIFIADYDDRSTPCYGLREAAVSVGTKSSYIIPLFTLDDKYIGCIGLDYVLQPTEISKDQWEHLQIYASRIAGFLQNHLQKT